MKYFYYSVKRFNKLGVLVIQYIVTVIPVDKKLFNLVYLLLSIRNITYKASLFASNPSVSILIAVMFKTNPSTDKSFEAYLSSLSSTDDHKKKDSDMVVDNPILEHESIALVDNVISLGAQSERIFESNLIIVGGIPCNVMYRELCDMTTVDLSFTAVDHQFSLILTMTDEYYFIPGADFRLLEQQARSLNNLEVVLYTDGNPCLSLSPLETRDSDQISLVTVQPAGLSPDRPSTIYE